MESIFTYSDYRKFLSDYFEEQKKIKTAFSHRFFAQKAGFRTSNFMHLVIKGERNLTKQSLTKITLAMGLKKTEADYFENLVFFNQSQSIKEKNFFFEKITAARKTSFIHKINKDQFEYYSHWYHLVVREVASFNKGDMDEKSISDKIRPRVSLGEIRKSLELLMRLGFLKKNSQGRYIQTAKLLSTGPEAASLALANYHIKTMALAAESIERFKPDKRDISSLTLGITADNFKAIKKRLQEFRKEILAMAEEENPDLVYQFNFQLFPLTRVKR
jgi:uncharacterized protein (TIGR02147 family)